jgi:hypothetical protein
MPTPFPVRVQAIRSRGQNPRLYITIPMALATAIGVEPGEQMQWELLERDELHLIRLQPAPPQAKSKAPRRTAKAS